MSSLRGRILNHSDWRSELVRIDEWDLDVECRSLSGAARARFVELTIAHRENRPAIFQIVQPFVIIQGTYDPESHERIFEDGDTELLLTKSPKVLDTLSDRILDLSGLNPGADDEAGNVSAPIPSGVSDSD